MTMSAKRYKLSEKQKSEGWIYPSKLPPAPNLSTGFTQVLIAYESFAEDAPPIVGQGIYLPENYAPTTKSVEEAEDAKRRKGLSWNVSPELQRLGLHFVQPGWYVVFGTLVDHGGAGYQGVSWKPTWVRVEPYAWRALPEFHHAYAR